MMRWLLRLFGYYKIDYGFSGGRYWMSIDGKVIAQAGGEAVPMFDEEVLRLIKGTIAPPRWVKYPVYIGADHKRCRFCGNANYDALNSAAPMPTKEKG